MRIMVILLAVIAVLPSRLAADTWVWPAERDYYSYCFNNCPGPGARIPFRIEGITPGTYRLKAVWDKAAPYSFGDDYIKGPLESGDYENRNAPTITVEAGQKVENVKIDCTDKVAEQGG